ncbi:MAG: hypothetical protein Kow00124_08740 [Anaerolineae bacterium]
MLPVIGSLLMLLMLSACEQTGLYTGTLVLEGVHELEPGERLEGELVILNGQVTLPESADLSGSLYMLGGEAEVHSAIEGDVTLLGGTLTLGPEARVRGNLEIGGGTLNRSPEALIEGMVNTGTGMRLPEGSLVRRQSAAQRLFGLAGQAILLIPLAVAATYFAPRSVGRVRRAITRYPIVSAALGALAAIVFPALLVMAAFTIILIPVTLIGMGLLVLTIAYSGVAYGAALGQIIARWLKWQANPSASTALGTAIFLILVNALDLIPIAGSILVLITAALGLGAVLLTRFGLHDYTPPQDEGG